MKRKAESFVEKTASGMTISDWLSARFKYHSKDEWNDILVQDRILIDEKTADSDSVVHSGQKISFICHDIPEPEVIPEFSKIYEDDFFLAVSKSGNLPVHPAGPYFKNTLWFLMKKDYPDMAVVNRLDRETSGLVLISKLPDFTAKFAEIFQKRKLCKKYLALVFGNFKKQVIIEGHMTKDKNSRVRKKQLFVLNSSKTKLSNSAKYAKTSFYPIESSDKFTIIEAVPETGRTHQIRATLLALGYPIVGDKLYGKDETVFIRFAEGKMNDKDREKLIMKRQALHASELSFIHPFTQDKIELKSEIPEDMKQIII